MVLVFVVVLVVLVNGDGGGTCGNTNGIYQIRQILTFIMFQLW